MTMGTLNETPIAERLKTYKWMVMFFECGALELVAEPWIAVSPDGFAFIYVVTGRDDSSNREKIMVLAVAEMKRRFVEDTTITLAEAAVKKYGKHVQCVFGDKTFLDCVPDKNSRPTNP